MRVGATAARPAAGVAVSIGTIATFCAAAAAAGIAAVLLGLSTVPIPVEGWRLAARWTARVSFLIFLPVYLASAWYHLAPGAASRWLLRRRRAAGLAFATAHTIHLGALVTFIRLAAESRPLGALLVGGGAYVTMYAMVATSNDAAVRWLGRGWKRLHTFGIHYLWFVFAVTYLRHVAAGEASYAPQLALTLAALGLRLAARRRRHT